MRVEEKKDILDSETKLIFILEDIKNSRNVLTAKSRSILSFFSLDLKMTKLNSQTKMTKLINQKMTI